MFGVAAVMEPEMAPAIEASSSASARRWRRIDAGHYVNFTEEPHDVAELYPPDVLERLREVRAEYDPDGLFRANHAV